MERTVFDNEKLIILVEPNPCLWDTAHPDYCDRNKKQKCWVQIAKEMCDNFEEMTAVQQNEYGKTHKLFFYFKYVLYSFYLFKRCTMYT